MRKNWKILMLFFGICSKILTIEIMPTEIYLEGLKKIQTKEVVIFNPNPTPMRVQISVDKPEGINEEFYMGNYTKIYPKILSLRPMERKTARISVKTPDGMKEGEYRTELKFREIDGTISQVKDTTKNIAVDLKLTKEIIITAYGMLGKRDALGEFKSISARKGSKNEGIIKTTILPKGNSSMIIKYKAKFLDGAGKVLGEDESYLGRIERGSNGTLEVSIGELPKGTAVIKMDLSEAAGQKFGEKVMKL